MSTVSRLLRHQIGYLDFAEFGLASTTMRPNFEGTPTLTNFTAHPERDVDGAEAAPLDGGQHAAERGPLAGGGEEVLPRGAALVLLTHLRSQCLDVPFKSLPDMQ